MAVISQKEFPHWKKKLYKYINPIKEDADKDELETIQIQLKKSHLNALIHDARKLNSLEDYQFEELHNINDRYLIKISELTINSRFIVLVKRAIKANKWMNMRLFIFIIEEKTRKRILKYWEGPL